MKLEKVPVPRAALAEGPRWDAATGTLLWVDIPAGHVHRLDPAGDERETIELGQPVGVAVPHASGGLMLALRDGFARHADGRTELVARPSEPEGNRMNDGACDRAGRFFAGTKAEDDTPGAGSLYRLAQDLTCDKVLDGVTISNGVGWSPDERLMYYVDTATDRIDVHGTELVIDGGQLAIM
ncbi:SMP-30/gluconolactonase/LRE family protein [Nonomuraea sp. NPDC001636]|uniref:SMP-30/gluconolactonase/LRE family protein n=1 Tax=Nonomuraea sp. NPDC001636 TaxID=3154391 RepID=UPI00332066E5